MPDLPRDLVATMGIARQCLHADNALAACGARVSDRDRCFDAKLVSHPRLAFGDAFQIRRVQGIKLVRVASHLGECLRHALASEGECCLEFLIAGNIAVEPAARVGSLRTERIASGCPRPWFSLTATGSAGTYSCAAFCRSSRPYSTSQISNAAIPPATTRPSCCSRASSTSLPHNYPLRSSQVLSRGRSASK